MVPSPPSGPAPSGPVQGQGLIQDPARPARRLEKLLADLGPQIRRIQGDDLGVGKPLRCCSTGLAQIDRLLGGGIPRGRLSEISGTLSSGRTSLALALLASTTRNGACTALVDRADGFDPRSAETAGVDLDRVLWVRALGWREALRCTERLLETEGFSLVLLDMPPSVEKAGGDARSSTCWLRLARSVAQTQAALVVLSPQRLAGSHAEIVLEMQPTRARFSGTPALLEEFETQAVLVRHRSAPVGPTTSLRLRAHLSAA